MIITYISIIAILLISLNIKYIKAYSSLYVYNLIYASVVYILYYIHYKSSYIRVYMFLYFMTIHISYIMSDNRLSYCGIHTKNFLRLFFSHT